MKTNVKKYGLLILAAVLLVAIAFAGVASAEVFSGTDGGIDWEYDDSSNTLTISPAVNPENGFTAGEMKDYTASAGAAAPWHSNRSDITTLILNEGITKISDSSFRKIAITELTLPSTVESIGNAAFFNCKNVVAGDLVLPKGLTLVRDYAFHSTKINGKLIINSDYVALECLAFYNTGLSGTLDLSHVNPDAPRTTQGVFQNCNFTGSLVIPAVFTQICDSDYRNNSFTQIVALSPELRVNQSAFSDSSTIAAFDFSRVSSLPISGNGQFGTSKLGCIFYAQSESVANNVTNGIHINTSSTSVAVTNGGIIPLGHVFEAGKFSTPVKDNSGFVGWWSKNGTDGDWGNKVSNPAPGTTYYAKWVDTTGMDWYNNGVSSGVFTISTATDLEQLASLVNQGVSFEGQTVMLGADIVLNDETFTFNPDTGLVKVTDGTNTGYVGTGYPGDDSGSNTYFDTVASVPREWYINEAGDVGAYGGQLDVWTPIGTDSKQFKGIFDGCGHTVSGLYYDVSTNYQGFIGFATSATISNLTIDYFISASAPTQNTNVGVAVGGSRWGASDTILSNITVSGIAILTSSFSGNAFGGIIGAAGIAHPNKVLIENCTSYSYVFGNGGYERISGIVGFSNTCNLFVENCSVFGYYTRGWKTAGIVGQQSGGSGTNKIHIDNCLVSGVIDRGGYASGLTGHVTHCLATNCISLCSKVNGSSAGRVGPTGSGGGFSNCYAWEGMLLNGQYVVGGTASNLNGANVSSVDIWNNQSFFQNTLGWDFTSTWEMSTADNFKLPVLKGMTAPNYDASYLKPITVSFDTQGGSAVADQKISKGLNATRPATNPTRTGYSFENWYNEATCVDIFDFEARLTADTTVYANWSAYSATNSSLAVTGSAKVATFDDNANVVKSVAIQNATSAVSAVAVTYEPNTAGPSSDGSYTRHALTTVFNITLTGNLGSDNATIVFNLTTAELNGASPANIYLAHKKDGAWEYLKPSYVQTGNVYAFTVTGITSFSPFVPISMSAVPQPAPSSSSPSRETGKTIILTETPTPVPTTTPTPTGQPTIVPGNIPGQQTQQSPAPFVGLIAGLGAAALFLTRLRK